MSPLLADFSHARACKPFCEKYLTLPQKNIILKSRKPKLSENQPDNLGFLLL